MFSLKDTRIFHWKTFPNIVLVIEIISVEYFFGLHKTILLQAFIIIIMFANNFFAFEAPWSTWYSREESEQYFSILVVV